MVQGTLRRFDRSTPEISISMYNMAKFTPITSIIGVIPALENYTETAGGQTLTTTWVETGGTPDVNVTGTFNILNMQSVQHH